jgi:hypothetical protein
MRVQHRSIPVAASGATWCDNKSQIDGSNLPSRNYARPEIFDNEVPANRNQHFFQSINIFEQFITLFSYEV